jgi:hypothetical protein
MNEMEQSGVLASTPTTNGMHYQEEEEPPSKRGRWPIWQNVPDDQWQDWRWQSQHAIRSARQIRDLLRFTSQELAALKRLDRE